MDLPRWGWLLVALWLAAGVGGFFVFLQRFGSAYAVWYYLPGEEGLRPFRTFTRLLPLVAVLLFCLLLGPLAGLIEVQSQREAKQKSQRKERGRERRRLQRASVAAPEPRERIDRAGS